MWRRLIAAAAAPSSLAALFGFAFVAPVAADQGGYYADSWGWAAVALLWAAALALVLRRTVHWSRLEVTMIALLSGFTAWVACSTLWAGVNASALREVQRDIVYVAGLAAVVLVVRSASYRALLGGVAAATTLICTYGLATRLFPERLGTFDSVSGYRLQEPLGYWNALGLFAAIGFLLALGFAARARDVGGVAFAGAALPILLTTLYFTFSRGAWLALAAGVLAAVAVDRRRLELITAFVVLSGPAALGVWFASQADALTHLNAPLAAASRDGHRVAAAIVVLAVISGLLAVVVRVVSRAITIAPPVRLAYALLLAVLVAAVLGGIFVRYGAPPTLAARAYDAVDTPLPETGTDLNRRLFTIANQGRVQQWRVAWRDREAHPLLGSGAGTYEAYWMQHRPAPFKVRDAHSLYLEALAELGPVGLALLATALAVPLVAAARARSRELVPLALGAYAAYLIHAGVDWDWEMPAVTLTALFCGAAVLVAARSETNVFRLAPQLRMLLLGGVVALSALAFVSLIGNSAVAASKEAVAAGEWENAATHARKARRWMPWSPEPWRQLAEAQIGADHPAAARESLRQAIAKDPKDWSLWLDYGLLSRGEERRRALTRAAELNPLSPEIRITVDALRRTMKGE